MIEKAVYRIIDANGNRAREALRVMEEYCRFALNHTELSSRVKQLRHLLCRALAQLPAERLLTCRNSTDDVGANLQVKGQLHRTHLTDSLTAGCKRFSEALRALTETTQTFDPHLAQTFEKLRFSGYELEKDICTLGLPSQRFRSVQLYVLISAPQEQDMISLVQACAQGGADCIQLRHKGLSDRQRLALARPFVEVCQRHQVLSIVNDRVDIAVASGADGVHLGQDDLTVEMARQLQTTPLIIGSTTHNRDELKAAQESRPTYIALGPAFSTETKPQLPAAGLDYLRTAIRALASTDIGHVAIGGITETNLPKIVDTGARCIAVCGAVTKSEDPEQACSRIKTKMIHLINREKR